MQKLYLQKDLRKRILQGHPWVYGDALQSPVNSNALAQLYDRKKTFLAWGFCDVDNPISFRVLSLGKQKPTKELFSRRLETALKIRQSLLTESNNIFRLLNGEGDGFPGLVADVYGDKLVLQTDGEGASEFWLDSGFLHDIGESLDFVSGVCLKKRGDEPLEYLYGPEFSSVQALENGISYIVDVSKGQKTGFFIDQRENRQYVRQFSKDKKVVNLFSYTGGFSLAAGVGGAKSVLSVDISDKALQVAQENWQLNQLAQGTHETLKADIFAKDFIVPRGDLVIVDPPSMASSEKNKVKAMDKYIYCFAQVAKSMESGTDLILSSCSSHIHFSDFFQIIETSLSHARKQGRVISVRGQGMDHPFPHICPEFRYLKFVHLHLI